MTIHIPRRTVLLTVQAVVTIGLIYLLLKDFDRAAFAHIMSGVSPLLYVGSFAGMVVIQLLYSSKWKMILGAMNIDIGFPQVFAQHIIALFFNNFLPTSIGGDVSKVYYLRGSIGFVNVAVSVVVDRLLSLFIITLVATGSAWLILPSTAELTIVRVMLAAASVGICAVLLFGVLVGWRLWPPLASRVSVLIPVAKRLEDLRAPLESVARNPSVLGRVVIVVLGYYAILAAVYGGLLHFSSGSEASLIQIFASLTVIALFANIPISLNGVGLREQLHFVMLGAIGIPKEAAVAISLIVYSQLLLLSLVGCTVWLKTKPGRPGLQAINTPA
jgi:uncharacterized protein (TIRG00374 family)